MAIRKFGAEPAQTEVRSEDNDQETLSQVRKQARESTDVHQKQKMVYPIEPDWHE